MREGAGVMLVEARSVVDGDRVADGHGRPIGWVLSRRAEGDSIVLRIDYGFADATAWRLEPWMRVRVIR